MHINVPRDSFAAAVARAYLATAKKTPLSALQCILLQASTIGNAATLRVAATTQDIAIEATIATDITKEGTILIPADRLAGFVAATSGDWITIQVEKKRAKVSAGDGVSATFPLEDPDDFPDIIRRDRAIGSVDAAALRQRLKQVAFATAQDESRPNLSGIHLALREDGGLVVSACNSFIFASGVVAFERAGDEAIPGMLLSPAGFKGLQDSLARPVLVADDDSGTTKAKTDGDDGPAPGERARLFLSKQGTGLGVDVGGATFFARLMEGNFPNLDRLLETNAKMNAGNTAPAVTLTFDRAVFAQAIRTVEPFYPGGDQLPIVMVSPAEDPGKLTITSDDRFVDSGIAAATIAATIAGLDRGVLLNGKHLRQIAQGQATKTLTVKGAALNQGFLVQSPEDPGLRYFVMPSYRPQATAVVAVAPAPDAAPLAAQEA